jgi:hypothetical protein
VDYLSDEWIRALIDAAADTSVDQAAVAEPLVIQTIITGAPSDEVAYRLVLDGSSLSVERGRAPDPTVTFTQTFATAAAVASGRSSAQAAFMAGDIRVGGDVTALIQHRTSLAGFDTVMARLAPITVFPDVDDPEVRS